MNFARLFDGYAQDDWRVLPNLSLNLGVRYEYNGPYVETQNQIANLDVNFNPQAVVGYLVLPGNPGHSLEIIRTRSVRPSRNDARADRHRVEADEGHGGARRIRNQLRPFEYSTFVHDFAFQPPFAIAQPAPVPDPELQPVAR